MPESRRLSLKRIPHETSLIPSAKKKRRGSKATILKFLVLVRLAINLVLPALGVVALD